MTNELSFLPVCQFHLQLISVFLRILYIQNQIYALVSFLQEFSVSIHTFYVPEGIPLLTPSLSMIWSRA